MLQKLHEKIKGWVASVIIGLLCLVFVLWGIEYYVAGSQSKGNVVAKVDDVKITEQEVNQLARQLQQQERANGGDLTAQNYEAFKAYALQNLMAEIALMNAAQKLGFTVQQQQLQQVVTQIPTFQENGQFSSQRFQQFLYDRGLTQQQLLMQLKKEILINQVRLGIEESAFLLPGMVDYYYQLFFQTRSFHYVTIPASSFLHKVSIDPKEEQAYYQNNKESLRTPEQVSIEYIELSPNRIRENIHISDAELQRYYQDNIGNYKKPATWKVEQMTFPVESNATSQQVAAVRQHIEELVKKMQSGTSFESLYKAQQGSTVVLSEGDVSPAVQDILKHLRPLQVSAPFHTETGFQIVRLLSYTPATTQSFTTVKEDIRTLLMQQKTQKMIAQMNDELSNVTFTNPDSLKPAAEALKVNVQTSEFFTEQGGKSGITANPSIAQVAFSKEVLQQKNNSNPITLPDGTIIVLRIKKYLPSQIPDFSVVQNKIHQLLIGQKAQAQAALFATELMQLLQQGKSVQSLLQQHQLHWQEENHTPRENKKIPEEMLTAAFNLSLNAKERLTTLALANGDSVVIQLLAIQKPAKINPQQQQSFQQQLQNMIGQIRYQLYLLDVQANTKTTLMKN